MYRPSVQAVPGAKVLRHHPVARMAQRVVRNGQDALNARNAVSRHRSRSPRPNAASGHGGRCRLPIGSRRSTVAVSVPPAVPTTRRGG
ncbi:hypothetical protein BS329_25750 [Amycolatopsis coloradensis]|uniref:Uncharacterized protein n=1 Tax=Amycolatopsis coloradensis TaxID=76021 RepID=A0A1R0KL28_9PSEU|nr:hypothetical protein BS329_25750 [Amycolatopsis coloradensis]